MFSKEESKQLRHEFWTSFGKSFPRKWVLYNTKIKGLSLKFHFDTGRALVAMDIDLDNLEKRIQLWEKLNALGAIITSDFLPEAIFEDTFILDNQKEISRIYVEKNRVSIHNKNNWQETMVFLNESMQKLEAFFENYKEVIKT